MFPTLIKLAQNNGNSEFKTDFPLIGRLKAAVTKLFNFHAENLDLAAVEADAEKMVQSGLDWALVIFQLLQKYGPMFLDLIADLRKLFNK